MVSPSVRGRGRGRRAGKGQSSFPLYLLGFNLPPQHWRGFSRGLGGLRAGAVTDVCHYCHWARDCNQRRRDKNQMARGVNNMQQFNTPPRVAASPFNRLRLPQALFNPHSCGIHSIINRTTDRGTQIVVNLLFVPHNCKFPIHLQNYLQLSLSVHFW